MKKTHSVDVQPKSITVTISDTLARTLEEFSRIALTTPEELVQGMLGDHIAQDSRRGRVGEIPNSLGNYIFNQKLSRSQAEKVACSCNAFMANEAERLGIPISDTVAMVEPGKNGSFHVWTPRRRLNSSVKRS